MKDISQINSSTTTQVYFHTTDSVLDTPLLSLLLLLLALFDELDLG